MLQLARVRPGEVHLVTKLGGIKTYRSALASSLVFDGIGSVWKCFRGYRPLVSVPRRGLQLGTLGPSPGHPGATFGPVLRSFWGGFRVVWGGFRVVL